MNPYEKRANRVLVIVFFTVFLDLAGFGIIIPLLPLYVQSMNGSALTVGFLLSCFSFTQFIATPILGRLSDRVGRRRVILTSLAGNTASMILFALATNVRFLPLLFASRILAGATAGNISACQAAIADVTEGPARAAGMGRIGAAVGLGMALGPAMGSFTTVLGPAGAPLAAAALAAIDLIAAFFLMPETLAPIDAVVHPDEATPYRQAQAKAAPAQAPSAIAMALAEPAIAQVLLLYFLTFLYMTTLQVAYPLLAAERLGWNARNVGWTFALFGTIGLVIQGFLIGRLTRKFGAYNLIIVGALASIVGLLAMAGAHSSAVLIGALTLFGIGFSLTQPILSTIAAERAGAARRGLILGYAQSAGGLARTIGPTGTGLLYAQVGPRAAFIGGAIAASASFVLAVVVRFQSKSENTLANVTAP